MKSLIYHLNFRNLFFGIALLLSNSILPQNVYHIIIDKEIDLGVAPYIRRVVEEANAKNADAIIFEINTFGGRVDAATQIKDAILNSKIMTVAYINKRAVSAGALISLSCRKIVMASGSVIGASTVVDGEGKKQSEKYQAYMRSEMKSTAERNGRRGDIAEGMVDETVVVADLNDDASKLISLTNDEAKKYGICDTIGNSINEVLAYIGRPNAAVIESSLNWAERFVGFLNAPFVSSLLIMIGLIGIYAELKSPGLGFTGIAGIVALTLFFGSSYILQLASFVEIFLFVIGLVLLIIEIFLIPGFGFTGVAGIALMIGSIFFSLFSSGPDVSESIQRAIVQMAVTLMMTIGIISILVKYLPKSDRFLKMTLQTQNSSASGFVSGGKYDHLIGSTGITYTPLRPAGVMRIDNDKFDVVTDGDFIEKNQEVSVIKVEGSRIVVTAKK